MPTRTEFEKAFHDVAEGRDPDEEVDVGGEPLPAMRVVRELLTSSSIMPHAACSNLGLERGSTYADGAEAVLEGWREAGLVARLSWGHGDAGQPGFRHKRRRLERDRRV
jgi:hypothetical protein